MPDQSEAPRTISAVGHGLKSPHIKVCSPVWHMKEYNGELHRLISHYLLASIYVQETRRLGVKCPKHTGDFVSRANEHRIARPTLA